MELTVLVDVDGLMTIVQRVWLGLSAMFVTEGAWTCSSLIFCICHDCSEGLVSAFLWVFGKTCMNGVWLVHC